MANREHVERLLAGVAGWNAWRRENRWERPDLRGVNLSEADLSGADLSGANLRGAIFYSANLQEANLQEANLQEANLHKATLTGATLIVADLSGATLSKAALSKADLRGADLIEATLIEATLTGATLIVADLRRADLRRANLHKADLRGTNLSGADLSGADLSRVYFASTIVTAVDLRGVQGLDTVMHRGPSSIGLDTIERSQGQIPESFLRGCGVSDELIDAITLHTIKPIQYYSTFISYSSHDEALAERLHADLQANGVRCWYAPHDLPIGARIRVGIDEAIRLHDKLLLILSKHSVASDWVEKEVETAMEQERRQKRTVLFPIRLDPAVMKIESGWPADVRRGRNIGDFCKWKQHDKYEEAFARLLRDLRSERTTRA